MRSESSVSIDGDRPDGWRRLDIAMIGQKGLPATFGGIERHVEELGARLAARGHRVRVYCRDSYATEAGAAPDPVYRGMLLRNAPTIGTKHLDAIVHSATSTALAMTARCDIVHYHALGPGLVAPLPRYLSPSRVVLTVHGLDHQRGKWGRGAQAVLGTAHWMSGHVPDRTVVVSRTLQEHYRREFGRDSVYIPNGVDDPAVLPADQITRRFGLEPGSYALWVGRIVPEKAPDALLRAYAQVPGDQRLVIVGDSSFSDDYTTLVRDLAAKDPRILLTGFAFGDLLRELYRYAGVFVQPSLLEGLPLTLLEAASYGIPIVASDIPPHLEVLGEQSLPGRRTVPTGDENALAAAISHALRGGSVEIDGARALRTDVLASYNWDRATLELERLYLDLVGARRSSRPTHPSVVASTGRTASILEGHP